MIEDVWTTNITVVVAAAVFIVIIVLYLVASIPVFRGKSELSVNFINLFNSPYNFASMLLTQESRPPLLENALYSVIQNSVFSESELTSLHNYLLTLDKDVHISIEGRKTIFSTSKIKKQCGPDMTGYCRPVDEEKKCGPGRTRKPSYDSDCKLPVPSICCVDDAKKISEITASGERCGPDEKGFCEPILIDSSSEWSSIKCSPGRTALKYNRGLISKFRGDRGCEKFNNVLSSTYGICCMPEEKNIKDKKIIEIPLLYKNNQRGNIIISVG